LEEEAARDTSNLALRLFELQGVVKARMSAVAVGKEAERAILWDWLVL